MSNAYADRVEAGQRLAQALSHLQGRDDLVVLGVARGGVVVAAEVARALRALLDVTIVRKIGAPADAEFAIGAVGEGAARVLHLQTIREMRVPEAYLEAETLHQQAEVQRRLALYRGGRPPLPLAGKTVVLVDDGIATGATMGATLEALRGRRPARLILAVPVAARQALEQLAPGADEVVCPLVPEVFWAVGSFYRRFPPVPDEEVMRLLQTCGAQPQEGEAPSIRS
ncbi:MAG: phosphoribosyltransferase [Chloroflexi bacterium]|nr:phosphoribosyltransferase [Chloroflexota bacterium]